MQGDPQARFRAFFEQHYEAVLRYVLRRIGAAAAEDVAAEVFLVSWRRFDEVPADPLPWLFGVARNVVANHRRGIMRREMFISRLKSEPTRSSRDPGDEVTSRGEILAAFRKLSRRDQETLSLVAWEGLSAPRAAKVLGCSVGAFWVRLHRARRRLADELDVSRETAMAEETVVINTAIEVERG